MTPHRNPMRPPLDDKTTDVKIRIYIHCQTHPTFKNFLSISSNQPNMDDLKKLLAQLGMSKSMRLACDYA